MNFCLKAVVLRPLLSVALGLTISKRTIRSCIGCGDVG